VVKTGEVSIGYCNGCDLCATITPEHSQIKYECDYTSSNGGMDGKLQKLLDFMEGGKGAKALEIGCYDGMLANKMKQFGWDVQGCDPCEWAGKQAMEKYSIKVKQAEFAKELYHEKFDVVVARNVLEHAENPMVFVKDVLSILKPKGMTILVVPDGMKRIREGILGSIVPEHFWYFGEESLSKLLHSAGFGTVEIAEDNGTLMVKAWVTGKQDFDELSDSVPNYKRGVARAGILHQMVWNEDRIILYGANTCALELLSSKAIDPKKVVCAIDDDPYKWGKVLVNTDIVVYPRSHEVEGTFVICSYYSQDALAKVVKGKVITLYPPRRTE
jgi:SAM-dependent methyltransferase